MTRKIKVEKPLPDATPWEKLVQEGSQSEPSSQDQLPSTSRSTPLKSKKVKFMEKLRKKREQKGILLLPPKVEQKISRIKKALKAKGMPGEKIKEELRRVRRKEEIKFKKELNNVCFKCRQPGHVLSECPEGDKSLLCFKCGSTDHLAKECKSNIKDFPHAKCFTCQEVGHITRNCPHNEKGIFPKGGACFHCGAKDHLKNNCPKKTGDKDDDQPIVAHTIDPSMSADAEIY